VWLPFFVCCGLVSAVSLRGPSLGVVSLLLRDSVCDDWLLSLNGMLTHRFVSGFVHAGAAPPPGYSGGGSTSSSLPPAAAIGGLQHSGSSRTLVPPKPGITNA
jgi:hypothetical protein